MAAVCTTTGHISDIRHQNRWWRGGIRYVGNKRYENRRLSNCGGNAAEIDDLFSKRSGLDGSRSSLFFEAVRIITEMREKPIEADI